MTFKMKGPSLYPNYRGQKAGKSKNGAEYGPDKGLALNKDYPKGPGGRATSSPFQRKTGAKTKEQLLKEGFTPRDADQMIKDGATTGVVDKKKMAKKFKATEGMREAAMKGKKPGTGMKSPKKKDKPVSQEDFVPAYPGADYSKEQIAKMTEKEKMMKIDGYEPKKNKKTKK